MMMTTAGEQWRMPEISGPTPEETTHLREPSERRRCADYRAFRQLGGHSATHLFKREVAAAAQDLEHGSWNLCGRFGHKRINSTNTA